MLSTAASSSNLKALSRPKLQLRMRSAAVIRTGQHSIAAKLATCPAQQGNRQPRGLPSLSKLAQRTSKRRSCVVVRAGPLPNNGVFISNAGTLVGVNPSRGGGIFWLSDTTSMENVINTWDAGRLIQQSWYGDADGSVWPIPNNPKNWCWNPVQGGSYDNQPSRVDSLALSNSLPTQLTVTTTPRNWAGKQLIEDVKMTTTITVLNDGRVRINASMRYSGSIPHPIKDQELPACFFDAKYSTLTYKSKTTNAIVREARPNGNVGPTDKNKRLDADPTWAGYINPATGKGIYVSCAKATQLTAYWVFNPKNPPASNTNYLAPLTKLAIAPNSTTSYEVFIQLK